MRLQVGIERHLLPQVSILYNTDSAPNYITTISEFLAGIDKIIPLESADGEWGLEDYVVKAACRDGRPHVECLHYQLIGDVFRDDDEVWVRPLTSDEIRERRRGGRVQILPDGRHLYDGVAWGRRYNVNANRPGVIIPPRKRRKLLPAEDEDYEEDEEETLRLDYPGAGTQIGTVIDDEDNQEDNYEEEYNDEDEQEVDEQPLQVYTRQDFDNADSSSGTQDSDNGSDTNSVQPDELEEDELQLLLKEADEVEEAYHSLPLEFRITPPRKKRKRVIMDDDEDNEEDATFEGFSSPAKQSTNSTTHQEHVEDIIQGTMGDHVVTDPASDTRIIAERDSERATTSQSRLVDAQKTSRSAVNGTQIDTDENNDLTDSTSSEEASDSDSETSSASDEETSESESGLSSEINSSESESASDSETTSSSGDSDSSSDSEIEAEAISKQRITVKGSATNILVSEPVNKLRLNNPPGTGTKRTRANNNRVKLRKRLNALKEQGLLAPEANLEDLRAYEANRDPEQAEATEEMGIDLTVSSQLAQRKEEMLARLNSVYEKDTTRTDSLNQQNEEEIEDSQPLMVQLEMSQSYEVPATPDTEQFKPSESAQKRARLDVESSRRMLFNSLGLRNPKTPAAEQALGEKLAQPVRNIQTKPIEAEEPADQPANHVNDDAWKDKLIISAVECVQEGLILSPPPYPFKQRWERSLQKKRARKSEQFDQQSYDGNDDTHLVEENLVHPQVEDPQPLTDSRTISIGTADIDDSLYPTDITSLPALTRSDVQINAIIAYKQLHLNAKFEPEESPYRVARIVDINDDLIDVVLSKRDRDRPSDLDESTGERIYNKFEMPVEEERLEDDGIRETTFEDMIDPKLVRETDIQVARSGHDNGSAGRDTQEHQDSAIIPESAPTHTSTNVEVTMPQVNVDTPRRNEISNIIKDAGFSTNVDEQLLQPIDVAKIHHNTRSTGNGSRNLKSETQANSTRKESDVDWRSSSFEAEMENNASPSEDHDGSPLRADPSSPPSISMVESVNYPHVSLIDMNPSSLIDHTASSSHQNAQRISPDVPDIEHSDLTHLRVKETDRVGRADSQVSSLPSEVPASQPNGASAQIRNEDEEQYNQNSSVSLNGGNNAAGFEFGSESEGADSDGLPSLRALTSSQRVHADQSAKSHHSLSQPLAGVSPPPLRKNQSTIDLGHTSALGDSPKPSIKISASQKPSLTMSQVPQDTSIVDLTLSSDPVEPNNDVDEEYDIPRAKKKSTRNTKAKTMGHQDDRGASRAMKSALSGLGGKSRRRA